MNITIIEGGVWFLPQIAKCQVFEGEVSEYNENNLKITTWGSEGRRDRTVKEFALERLNWLNEENIFIGAAYETGVFILCNMKPVKLEDVSGSGFNYGSTNLIPVNEPGFIIILC